MSLGEALRRPLYHLYEERLLRALDRSRLPRHIGVIHDGHRRFARAAGLPDYATSYRAGMDKVVEFLSWCLELEVPAVTCWLLSKENLSRPPAELEPYFGVLTDLLGLTLLIPWTRKYFRRRLVAWFKSHFTIQTTGLGSWPPPTGRSEVIDSYVIGHDEKKDEQ